ncbi:MAG TPA: DinB family protein [Vicinamibacterales bacterium]|nr:DinB family protein [Vicinamibacterales bacterium]
MIRPVLLAEFDHEMAVTRRLLERCPSNFEWTPHQRSYTLGGLATHLARLPRWGEWILTKDGYDLVVDHVPQPPAHGALADVLETFDGSVATARGLLIGQSDAELAAPWTLSKSGQKLMTMPRMSAFKTLVVSHTIHHRGQLSVYLRLLDVPVPPIYGPTADETM